MQSRHWLKYASISGCLALSFCWQFNASPAFAGMEEALKAYNKGQYNKASEAFQKIVDVHPDNFQAHCYLAGSLYHNGRVNEAIDAYWVILKKFPEAPEARGIKAFLFKKDPNFSRNASRSASSTPGAEGGDVEMSETKGGSKRPTEPEDLANAMVGKVKPLGNRPNVSGLLVMDIKSALKEYPLSVLNLLYSKGCKILVTPTYIDRDPASAGSRPQGFEYGSTWKDCPGRFDGRNVIVCEYTIGNGVDLEKAADPIGILRHEIGHALDKFLGDLSSKPDFKLAYDQDLHKLDEFVKPRLQYYIQTEGNGPAETFAELAAAKYGGRTMSPGRKNRSVSIANLVFDNFPSANKVLESKLASFQ